MGCGWVGSGDKPALYKKLSTSAGKGVGHKDPFPARALF